jgi:hypothetical protein
MLGSPTVWAAAHIFSGRERVQIRRLGQGEALAIVRGSEALGPSRLRLNELDGEWYVEQATFCQSRTLTPN